MLKQTCKLRVKLIYFLLTWAYNSAISNIKTHVTHAVEEDIDTMKFTNFSKDVFLSL